MIDFVSSTDSSHARVWIGIDVSKDKLDAALVRESGPAIFDKFANTADGHERLLAWALRQAALAQRHFCLEATGRYSDAISHALYDAGERVSVVNPATVKYSGPAGAGNKTDKADARKIAHFARKEQPALWQPPAPELAELTELKRHAAMLTEERARYLVRLQQPGISPAIHSSLEQVAAILDDQIDSTLRLIDEHIDGHLDLKDDLKRLETIPGIAKNTAQMLLAELPPLKSVLSSQSVAAFFGVSPRQQESGKSRRLTRASKNGRQAVRAALYWPAVTAMRCNPPIQALAQRMRSAGKCNMQIIVAAMRKLLMQAYGVLKHKTDFDPEWAQKRNLAKA